MNNIMMNKKMGVIIFLIILELIVFFNSSDIPKNKSFQLTSVITTILASANQPAGGHPKIWLTPALLTKLKAKAAANDPDWVATKSQP